MRASTIAPLIAGFLLCTLLSSRAATVSPPPPDVTRLVAHAPMPDYPSEAVERHIAGHGVFLLRVHIPSGRVTQVIVGLSTGTRILDAAAIQAFQQWRFKRGAVPYRKITSVHMSPPQKADETLVKVPVTFT
jgi:TonB family protein